MNSLLIDLGNTSLKYAYFDQGKDIADLQVMRSSIDSVDELIEPVQRVWLCSVRGDKQSSLIEESCKKMHKGFTHVSAQKTQFGLINAYNTPSNMGSDRWMALIAASALYNNGHDTHFIVIDAGTAITCDVVVANKHLGGWIAPGLQMARENVVGKTEKVFDDESGLDLLRLGTDTPQCVANGALAQISGLVINAIHLMEQKLCAISNNGSPKFQIFVSGGDAPVLIKNISEFTRSYSAYSLNYIENLVLVGLARIATEKV